MTAESPIRRRPTNLSLEEDLVAEARRLSISLSRAAEAGLRRAVAEEAARRWQADAEGIRQMNAYVVEHGLPLAKYRLLMGEFAIHALGSGILVVDVQSELLEPFATRVVIPLLAPEHASQAPRCLNPVFEVAGSRRILATQLLAALPRAELGAPIGSLAAERAVIRSTLDMLFLGF